MEQVTKYQDPTTIAERGGIYEFFENDGTYKSKLCLVVSNNDRQNDNIVSILMLSDKTDKFGKDVVEIPISSEKIMLARCGLVTYCRRSNLGCQVYKLSKHTMRIIGQAIMIELGLAQRTRDLSVPVDNEEINYKKMYEDLLSHITGNLSK